MLQLKEIFAPDSVIYNTTITSKKKVLEMLSKVVAKQDPAIDEQEVFELLLERERLGSTGFGNGVAIPHCRMEHCTKPMGVWLCLADAIDFDAMDEAAVDIFVGLVVPAHETDEHLQLLKQVVEVLKEAEMRDQLREIRDSQSLYNKVMTILT